jgi:Flp pilus assembly protein TadB
MVPRRRRFVKEKLRKNPASGQHKAAGIAGGPPVCASALVLVVVLVLILVVLVLIVGLVPVVVLVVLRILHNRRTSFLKSGTGLLFPSFSGIIHGTGGIFGKFRKIIEVSVNWKGVRLWN